MPATRTLNPLHFEDLEPHRFEDLVRQLAYDFRRWHTLEATGRLGADEGMDVRGVERAPLDDSVTPEEVGEDAGEEMPPVGFEERIWIIQCKRERSLPPARLTTVIDECFPAGSTPPYGFILAAATDFSLRAREVFRAEMRARGVQEFMLWGKAELEDKVFEPRHDHLLFAYFGISLQSRRRSVRAQLVKRLVFLRVDLFFLVYRDFSAYERYYGITARRVRYVPWKVNGLEHGLGYLEWMGTEEGDYIFASGVTHRDWRTLAEATAGLSIPLVISLPEDAQIRADGLVTTIPNLADFRCPARLVRNSRDPRWWMTLAANAKFCVLPIAAHSISASGISTGLAVMALGKCLIMSEGESTRGIFGPEHVVTVPPGDPHALRAAIVAVDQQPALLRQVAEAGRTLPLPHGDTARLHGDFIRAMQPLVHPEQALTLGSVRDRVREEAARTRDLP